MKKGDKVIITAVETELERAGVNKLSVDAILKNPEATIRSAGRTESEVITSHGIWVMPNAWMKKI